MTNFKLTKGWYIRKFDRKNWILAKMIKTKHEITGLEQEYEAVDGYYGTLESAYRGSLTVLPLSAKSNQELLEIIADLKKLKNIS